MQDSIASFVEKEAAHSHFRENEAVLNQPVPFWTFPTFLRHWGYLGLALRFWEFSCQGLSFRGERGAFPTSANFKKSFLQVPW